MDTVLQQQTDTNGQTIVTPNERQALLQKLYEQHSFRKLHFSLLIFRTSKWPLDLSTRIENQAYERSQGIKVD